MPNDRDILYSKKEYGITVTTLDFDKIIYRFVKPAPDLSRMSRISKRLAMFEDVTMVVFEVDLSLYDEVLLDLDDGQRIHTPGLHMALGEFGVMCSCIQSKHVILILDKYALFGEKIRTQPLQAYYPDYTGGSDYAMATDYLVGLFASKIGNKNRQLYYYSVAHGNQGIAKFLGLVHEINSYDIVKKSGLL